MHRRHTYQVLHEFHDFNPDDGKFICFHRSIFRNCVLGLELFSHVRCKTILVCVKLRHVSDFLCLQGASHSNPQRGPEVRPRLNDQECGGIWRDQCLLSGQSTSERLQYSCSDAWQVIITVVAGLYTTLCRLLDFVEKGRVSLSQCNYLVLDEADRMLDMGFMPEIQKMVEDPNMPKKAPEGERQTLMFSATFPDEVQESAQEFLAEDYLFLTIGMVGGACSDVKQVKSLFAEKWRFKILTSNYESFL